MSSEEDTENYPKKKKVFHPSLVVFVEALASSKRNGLINGISKKKVSEWIFTALCATECVLPAFRPWTLVCLGPPEAFSPLGKKAESPETIDFSVSLSWLGSAVRSIVDEIFHFEENKCPGSSHTLERERMLSQSSTFAFN